MTQKLPQIYTANHATFPIQIRKITVQISGNFWVTKYVCTFIMRIAYVLKRTQYTHFMLHNNGSYERGMQFFASNVAGRAGYRVGLRS